jgi:hypothetical protein
MRERETENNWVEELKERTELQQNRTNSDPPPSLLLGLFYSPHPICSDAIQLTQRELSCGVDVASRCV